MYVIRKEKRNPEKLQVLRMAEPLLTESASTDNVSSHGMRVRTCRPWKRDTHLIVQSSERELWGARKSCLLRTCAYRKCYPGANAFKISDLQEAENESIAGQAIRM
jgi:hypothetical protein